MYYYSQRLLSREIHAVSSDLFDSFSQERKKAREREREIVLFIVTLEQVPKAQVQKLDITQ